MPKFKVAVTDGIFSSYQEEQKVLAEVDCAVEIYKLSSEEEAIETLKDVDGILLNLLQISAKVIKSMKKCRIISRYGIGFDNVDIEAATNAGIWVANVPDYAFEDVSDHALALLLAAVRKIAYKDRLIRKGSWNLHGRQKCYRIKDKILGLIGYGSIAQALHRKISGFGLAKVLVYDPFIDREYIRDSGGVPCDLDTLLKESDYVSIHAPLTKGTRRMIGAKQISLMKTEAILVNTSRGPLINEKALASALKDKRIAYAGLDVFEEEPLPKDSSLRKTDNIVLSDHTAWYTEESIVELKTKAAQNISEVLKGEKPVYPLNNV